MREREAPYPDAWPWPVVTVLHFGEEELGDSEEEKLARRLVPLAKSSVALSSQVSFALASMIESIEARCLFLTVVVTTCSQVAVAFEQACRYDREVAKIDEDVEHAGFVDERRAKQRHEPRGL